MTVPDVTVRRHVVTCRVVGTSGAADRTVRAAVSQAWKGRLDEAVGQAGVDGYWIIRRVAVTAQVGAGWTADQVSTRLAVCVGQELGRRTGVRSDPESLWFPDRAAFVAQYLADLAAGRTGGRWEYAGLVGLGRAMESLVALADSEPETLVEALVRLRPPEIEQLAEVVPVHDEERLLAALAGDAEPSPRLLLPALRTLRSAGRLGGPTGTALLLAITAVRDDGVPLEAVAAPALDVAGLLAVETRTGPAWRALLDDLEHGRWGEASRRIGPDGVLSLVRWTVSERADLVDALAHATDTSRAAPVGERLDTPFGGVFLLLPVLDELWSWVAATDGWPPLGAAPAVGVAKLLTLTAALGRGRTTAVALDRLARLAVGGYDGDLVEMTAWVEGLSREHLDAFATVAGDRLAAAADEQTTLASPFGPSPGADLFARAARSALMALGRRLPGMATASPAYLWRNVLDFPASATVEDGRVLVELGSPPLAVLLSIAGLNRGDVVVEGARERQWTLTTRS